MGATFGWLVLLAAQSTQTRANHCEMVLVPVRLQVGSKNSASSQTCSTGLVGEDGWERYLCSASSGSKNP